MAKWGKCDFRQLKKLQKKMEKFSKIENEEFCEMCAKHLAARLLSRVIKETPVGRYDNKPIYYVTKNQNLAMFYGDNNRQGGTLRRSWSEENKTVHVKHKGNEFICEIVNSTEYAYYFEYGHRRADHKGWINGRFVLEKSTLQLDAQAPRIVEKLLMKKLGEIFNDQ